MHITYTHILKFKVSKENFFVDLWHLFFKILELTCSFEVKQYHLNM